MPYSSQGAITATSKGGQSFRNAGCTGRIRTLVLLISLFFVIGSVSVQGLENRVFIARGDNNYPPYEYIDENGQPAGWNIDLLKAVAEAEGLNISIRLGPWDEVRSELESGKIDLLAGMYYSPERARAVNFSSPHIVVSHAIFVRKGSGIQSLDDLKGRSVLVQRGDIMHDYIRNLNVTDKIVPVENQEDALILLSKGQYDCALVAKLQGIYNINHLGLTNLETAGPPIEPRDYCFAVSVANKDLIPTLNEGLAIVKTSGKYDMLYRKWFGVHEERMFYDKLLTLVTFFLLPAGIIILLALLWSWSLRRQVAKKTAELNAELDRRRQAEDTLKERENFLNNVVENIPDMIFVKDAGELRFVRFNKAGEELLGYSREDMAGKNDYDFFPEEEAAFFTAKDREVILKRQLQDIPEEKIQTRNLGLRILHTKKIPILDKEGNPQYLLGISEDITTRKLAEDEIIRKSGELRAAYEQLAAVEEELRHNYEELAKSQQALVQARKKLNLLNTVTFQDIENAVFALSGYFQLKKENQTQEQLQQFRNKEFRIVQTISESLKFAAQYQNLGLKPPIWQGIFQAFLFGISHVDLAGVSRKLEVGDLEIYADPLLEQVFFTLAENVLLHGKTATEIALRYCETNDGLVLVFEDNGAGIPDDMKENIFSRRYEEKKGQGLFLSREILSITGITITETGEPGKGARFEMVVPNGAYRFVGKGP